MLTSLHPHLHQKLVTALIFVVLWLDFNELAYDFFQTLKKRSEARLISIVWPKKKL